MDLIWYQLSRFQNWISFLLTRGGFSPVTINTQLGLSHHQVSQVLNYHSKHRNEVLTYQVLPLKAREKLFHLNNRELKQYAPEYQIQAKFMEFDRFAWKLGLLEKKMTHDPRSTLGEIFGQRISPSQARGLERGEWIEHYREVHHAYRKWLVYERKAFILIKESPTYFHYFSCYLQKLGDLRQ